MSRVFGFSTTKNIIISENINVWARKNKIILIPFQVKYLNLIESVCWDAINTFQYHPIGKPHGRVWKDKIKEMFTTGRPDYFAYKINKQHKNAIDIEAWFIELKNGSDYLSLGQLEWHKKYYKLPILTYYSLNSKKTDIKHYTKKQLTKMKTDLITW